MLKYNFKIIFSSTKFYCCAAFLLIITLFTYSHWYLDFISRMEFYGPMIGVALFTELYLINKNSKASEILFVKNKNQSSALMIRCAIMFVLSVVLLCVCWYSFSFKAFLFGIDLSTEHLNIIDLLTICSPSMLFLGAFSMSVANVLSNAYVGYAAGLIYWLYWNTNHGKKSLLNLFPFSHNRLNYHNGLLFLSFLSTLLLLFNVWLVNKSPFFFGNLKTKLRQKVVE